MHTYLWMWFCLRDARTGCLREMLRAMLKTNDSLLNCFKHKHDKDINRSMLTK